MQTDGIALGQQFVKVDHLHGNAHGLPADLHLQRFRSGMVVHVDHPHADAHGIARGPLADAAESDHTQGLAAQFTALLVFLLQLLELATPFARHAAVGLVQVAGEGEEVGDHQFGHGNG